jgi:hypothetical protein
VSGRFGVAMSKTAYMVRFGHMIRP